MPESKVALDEIRELQKEFLTEIEIHGLSKLAKSNRWWTVSLLIGSVVLALILRKGMVAFLPIDQPILSNYCFVWTGAMAALVIVDAAGPHIKEYSEYLKQERLLSNPSLRCFATGLVAVVLAIGLRSGAFSMRFGGFDTAQIEQNVNSRSIRRLHSWVCFV